MNKNVDYMPSLRRVGKYFTVIKVYSVLGYRLRRYGSDDFNVSCYLKSNFYFSLKAEFAEVFSRSRLSIFKTGFRLSGIAEVLGQSPNSTSRNEVSTCGRSLDLHKYWVRGHFRLSKIDFDFLELPKYWARARFRLLRIGFRLLVKG